jgi:RNA polymerase sigma-32 factor
MVTKNYQGSADFNVERNDIKEIREFASTFQLLNREEEFALTSEMWELRNKYIPLALSLPLMPQPLSVQSHFIRKSLLVLLVCRWQTVVLELINKNLRLILKVCQSPTYTGRGLPIYDLFMAGYEGLRYGLVVKFEPFKGFKLGTYCIPWIHQKIQRAISGTGSAIKIAGHKQDLKSKIRMVVREYVADAKNAGAKPTAETISHLIKDKYKLDLSADEIAELGRLEWSVLSLDDEASSNEEVGSLSVIDFIPAPEMYEPESVYQSVEVSDKLAELMSLLTDDERIVISMSSGTLDSVEKSIKQIAKLLGKPEKEVKDLVSSGMTKMKQAAANTSFFNI